MDCDEGAFHRILAVIEHGTRRIRILGATEHPAQSWVVQQARNLPMDLEDTGIRVKFMLHDRDTSFMAAFDAVFQAVGARVIPSDGVGETVLRAEKLGLEGAEHPVPGRYMTCSTRGRTR